MIRSDLDNRLRELGIYSDFYYRKELKALMQMLGEYERLNCLLTGVHEGNRKMVAVTDRRMPPSPCAGKAFGGRPQGRRAPLRLQNKKLETKNEIKKGCESSLSHPFCFT